MMITQRTFNRPQQPPANPPAQPAPPAQQQPRSALQRPATDLGTTQDGLTHLDGVRWDIENLPNGECIEKGVFSDAIFDPRKVKDVFLCIKPFTDQPMNAPGHALLKFEFEADSPVRNSQGQTDSALAISVEQHFHQGEAYDPNAKNPTIHQLGTWTDALEKANVNDHYPLQVYRMTLSHDQQVALLNDRVAEAVKDHSQSMYDAINNSCLSNLIDGVNKQVPEQQQIPKTQPDGSPDPAAVVPIFCPNNFAAHGLIKRDKPEVHPAKPKPPEEPPANTPPVNNPPALLMV
jgi:hypothetical protein